MLYDEKNNVSCIVILSLLISNTSEAQIRKIPAEVTNAFTEKFPQATNVEWRDQLVDFKVAFDKERSNFFVKFNLKGECLIMAKEIGQNDLLEEVKMGFSKSQYADWEVKYEAIIDTPLNDRQ